MQRPLAVLAATAALVGLAALGPAPDAGAATTTVAEAAPAPAAPGTEQASWVNGTLRIVYSWVPAFTPSSDSYSHVEVDGKVVDAPEEFGFRDRVVTVPRAASAGPAHVQVISDALVEHGSSSSYEVVPTVYYDAVVSRHVVHRTAGQVSSWTLLDGLRVANETRATSYSASRFRPGHDADGDGETTRTEVLKAESTRRVTWSRSGAVIAGRWVSPYDSRVLTRAEDVVVDRLVPLQEAWTSGAATWSARQRTAFAGDLGYGPSLAAVSKAAHRAKGADEPNAYLPAAAQACRYVRSWIAVKHRWGLTVDAAEKAALAGDLVRSCENPFVSRPGRPDIGRLAGR